MAQSLEEARARFRSRLAQAGVSEFIEDFLSVARPALVFRPCAAAFESDISLLFRSGGPANEDDIPLGSTKIGGRPDMPKDRRWPGRTMSFILQINLAQLPPDIVDLPREGLLSFFVDPDDFGNVTLDWYVPEAGRLFRKEPEDEPRLFLPRRLSHEIVLTLDLDRPEAPVRDDTRDEVYDALAVSRDNDFVQLGGDPHVLNSMLQECEECAADFPDLSEDDAQWRLVLQVGNIDECEIDWPGTLFVWMRAGDLRERHFERIVAIIQHY